MVSIASSVRFDVTALSLRRIPSPADGASQRSYVAVVNVFDLPDLTGWRRINVRDAKETGSVPQAIRETLDTAPGMFFFKNRGLVLTAERAEFNTENSVLSLRLSDPDIHGLLDGGHTYTVIGSYCTETDRSSLSPEQQAFVRVEILEGFDEDQIHEIVEARNTSNQVKDQSLLELEHRFEGIKAQVATERYADLIAYKEYEVYEGVDEKKRPKPIDIREIVSLLTVFDRDHFGDSTHPILAYSQKAACLKAFKSYPDSFAKIYPLTRDILRLWDTIHLRLPEWYKSAKASQGLGAKFGRFTGVTTGKHTRLLYSDETSEYSIPTAFKYPVLGALRAFLEEHNGQLVWGKGIDPFDALEAGLGEQLAEVVTSNAGELRNPTKLGKSRALWDQCYSKAQIWYLKA